MYVGLKQVLTQLCSSPRVWWYSELKITVYHFPAKPNLIGQIYCTFPMGKPMIVYNNVPTRLLMDNGQPLCNPYLCKGTMCRYGSCAITHSFSGNDIIIKYIDHVRWAVNEGQESMQQDGIVQTMILYF